MTQSFSHVHEARAAEVSHLLCEKIGAAGAKTAFVLGTGWGDVLQMEDTQAIAFQELPGFESLQTLVGHAREVVCGSLEGRKVIALRGRIHLNEAPADPRLFDMVRLQIEMLAQLGVENLVLTCAAGSLGGAIEVGGICVIDGFVSVFAPAMPLLGGEFCNPDDTLDQGLMEIAFREAALTAPPLVAKPGGYVMLRGPQFEGRRYDKKILAATGAKVVGMSVLPEACIAALHPGIKVLALAFVTNDDVEIHSHEGNVTRAKAASVALGEYLARIVGKIR